MNRQMAVAVLACLAGLWPAAAPAQYKINPPPIIKAQPPAPIQIKPVEPIVKPLPPIPPAEPPTPAPVVPAPVVKLPPTPLPPAPAATPVIEPKVPLPTTTLPVDRTGGLISDRERNALDAARDAARAGKLADQESGLDATMGAGPGDDRPGAGTDVDRLGFGMDDGTVMERFCKTKSARLFPGLCPGRDRGYDTPPSDGDLSGFYDTERPVPSSTDPGGSMSFEGPRAGSGVPSRGGQASDDEIGPPSRTYKDEDGNQHDVWTHTFTNDEDGDSENFVEVVRRGNGDLVYIRDGYTARDRSPGAQRGDYRNVQHTTQVGGITVTTSRRCRGWCDPESQPGESSYGQMKARPWFCARNPSAKGCQPTAPGSQIDPAHPDGEGTPGGSRPTAHRLGSGAVSDPGPADSEIRGTTGGRSRPLDMKDPVNPDDPEGPGRPPARP